MAHPSLLVIRDLTRVVERDGHRQRDWYVEEADVARQVWNCGATHGQAVKLVARWLGLEVIDEVDDLLAEFRTATHET